MKAEKIEALLHQMSSAASAETLPRFRAGGSVHNKLEAGFDPVTAADQAAEAAIRRIIMENCPDHGILGEEEADHNPDAEDGWIIDPIDGTRAFISGLPAWGTLIGLNHHGVPIAGMMHQPFTGEKYLASSNGAFLHQAQKRTELKTSGISSLAEATMMTTDPFLFEGEEYAVFSLMRNNCRLTRYGFDCYAYTMVAAGNIELVIESGLNPFDIAPLIPIIEKAGGMVTGWDGSSAAEGGRILASANESIHEEALKRIATLL